MAPTLAGASGVGQGKKLRGGERQMRFGKAIALASLFCAAPAIGAAAQEAYKIGASLGLTGYGSSTDGHWRDGLQLAIAALNAKGGVLGHKLELVSEDNK